MKVSCAMKAQDWTVEEYCEVAFMVKNMINGSKTNDRLVKVAM